MHHVTVVTTTMMPMISPVMRSASLLLRRSLSVKRMPPHVCFSSWYPDTDFARFGPNLEGAQRVWTNSNNTTTNDDARSVWTESVLSREKDDIPVLLEKIGFQELQGGRMAQRQLGVLREDPHEDMRLLTENYTVPSLASALRDREELLQTCAQLCKQQKFQQVATLLQPFQHEHVLKRRNNENKLLLEREFTTASLEIMRKALMRMPRRVVHAHQKRAGVVLALCNVNNVPSVLLEKRASNLRAHPDEVCLPGGMVSHAEDQTIVSTCLREMQEEIGGLGNRDEFTVLGILRCNWGEVHHLVGLAVTPLVCFVGDLTHKDLKPNPSEVAEVFTIPLISLLRKKNWIHRQDFAPVFVGGPHVIWGLSGYILERFVKDILSQYHVGH